MHRARALGMLVAALVAVAGVPLWGAGPAHAASYRFWSYWHGDTGSWTFSGIGADSWRLKDGAVEGWRFAVSPGTGAAPRPDLRPAEVWNLDACRGKKAGDGEVRAAVVIDFGEPGAYADGQQPPSDPVRVWCGVLPTRSTGMDLLNAATSGSLRIDGGMVCAISGLPSRGCGEVVADPAPMRTATPKATPRATPRPSKPGKSAGATTPPKPSGPVTSGPTSGTGRSPTTPTTTPATAPAGPALDPSAPSPGAVAGSGGVGPSGAAAGTGGSAEDTGAPSPVVGLPVASEADAAGTPWPAALVVVVLAALAATTYWRRRAR